MQRARIVIIGAGAAGLAAATRLTQNGILDFVILEAQNRTGGRIFSLKFENGEFIELGPQWIHGDDHEVFRLLKDSGFLLEKRTNSLLDEDETLGDFVMDQGRKVTDSENDCVNECLNFLNATIADLEKGDFSETEANERSFGEVLRERFEGYLSKESDLKSETLKRAAFDWILRYQYADNGCTSLDELSMRAFTDYKLDGDVTNRLKVTITDFLIHLAKDVPHSKIHFSKIIERISISDDETDQLDEFAVEILCEDGSLYGARHVICTVSLGVLKANPDLFFPALSAKKRNAIEKFGFGTICKILLEFDEPFWEKLSDGWKTEGFQPLWLNDQCDLKAGAPWQRWILGLNVVRTKENTLVVWVAGERCDEVDRMRDEDLKADLVSFLQKFTGQQNIPLPRQLYRERWSANRFFRGTYSYFSLEASKSGVEIDDLADPEWLLKSRRNASSNRNDGKPSYALCFAGEATHSSFYSTIHGAILSGRREADRIASFS